MSRIKKQVLSKLKEYANKMGRDHLGGDDIPGNKKKGGLRDNDGYDNVQYNRDMPQDESVSETTLFGEFLQEGIESVNEGKVDRVVGHTRYKYVGDGRKGQAIVSGPMKDREKEAIIKRAKKAGYNAKPNMGGGVTIHVESVNEATSKYPNFDLDKNIRYQSTSISKGMWRYTGKEQGGKGVYRNLNNNQFLGFSSDDFKYFKKHLKRHFDMSESTNEQGVGTATVFLKNQEELDEGGLPQNWMAGRTSDYHTKLRGKKRNYDDTNFAKMNTGQPDIEDEELDPDNEVVNEKFNKVEHLSLLNKALKAMPGSQNQKEIIRQLNVVRKAGGMRPLKEQSIVEYGSRLTNAYILDDESVLDGTPEEKDAINRESAQSKTKKNYKDWKNTNESVSADVYAISRMMGTAQQSTQDFIDDNKIDVKKLKSYIKKLSPVKMIIFKDIVHGSTDKRLRNIKKSFIKQVKESVIDETAKRDYKDEYKKFQSSTKSKKYRAELNKYNRDKGTYGNGDNKDASHKGGKIVGFESQSKNRGRAEKSRLKKK